MNARFCTRAPGRIRTCVDLSRVIYSHVRLTTPPPTQYLFCIVPLPFLIHEHVTGNQRDLLAASRIATFILCRRWAALWLERPPGSRSDGRTVTCDCPPIALFTEASQLLTSAIPPQRRWTGEKVKQFTFSPLRHRRNIMSFVENALM